MFPERARFIQYKNEEIDMFPEEASDEFLRNSENIPKIENTGAYIYCLVISFDGKTYKSGNK